GQQLDAVQVQCGWIARPLLPERESRQGQGSQLASGPEGRVQPADASLRAAFGGADRQVEPAAGCAHTVTPDVGRAIDRRLTYRLNVRSWHFSDLARCPQAGQRWGNRPSACG